MLALATETDLDRGPAGVGTERTCALSRQVRPADELIRFVAGPDNAVVPDIKRKLPGRGLWVTATRAAVETAVARRVFAKGFRAEVTAAPDLAALTDRLLERSALDALAIVAKSRCVVAGFGKTEDAIASGEAIALIHACEAAADGKRKLAAVRRQTGGAEIPSIEAFSAQQLDLALGRVNVIHAALLAGPVSTTFLARTRRLMRYRGVDDARDELRTE